MKIPFEQPQFLGKAFINLAPEVTIAILKTLETGWQIAKQKSDVAVSAKEIVITDCLRDGMREALKSGPLGKVYDRIAWY